MDNIILIGMPGAGKSTLGVLLAKAMNYDFMDSDLVIQSKTGELLYKTIEREGIDYFLKLENDVLKGIDVKGTIIATGGSAIFGKEAMQHLKDSGKVIYLKLSCEEIERRVNNITTRGIVMKKGKTIADIYAERVPLYEKYADIAVDCESNTIEQCIEKIIKSL